MQIALCSDSFLPIVDGVGQVVYQYATHLSQSGHECYVITPFQKTGHRGSYPFEIVDFLSVKMPTAPQYKTGIATLDPHYLARIASVELDILHAHVPGLAGIEAIRLADKMNVPVIGTFHSKYYDDLLRVTRSDVLASLGSRFVAEFYELCDEVWAVSHHAAETLHSYGYQGEIVIVPNGSELRTPSPEYERLAREKFNLEDEPILLYVGQLDFKKNLPRIIEAAALINKRGHAFQLVFVGQGKDKERLEKMSVENNLEKVIFTGHLTDRNLLDGLYMAASIFVFPSLYDTSGLVVREAAVMGTPSVVVKDTAPAEVIQDGVNGLLCSDTSESLANAIEHYIYLIDSRERDRIRSHAQEDIPLPWDKIMMEVYERYQRLTSKKRTRTKRFHPRLIQIRSAN